MAAFVSGEVIPMAVEQVSEDLRLHLAGGLGRIAIGIALIACGAIGSGDCRAIGVNGGSEDYGVAIGRPKGVVGFG